MRLIDIEKRMEEWGELLNVCFPNMPCQMLHDFLLNAPTIDAVPVVRCKDCKHWHRALLKFEDGSPANFGICDFMKDDFDTDETDFCSRGEREEK